MAGNARSFLDAVWTYALLTVGYVAITVLLIGLTNPALFAAYAGGMRPDAMQAVVQSQWSGGVPVALIVQSIVSTVIGTLFFAVFFGTVATAAVELASGDRFASVFE